MIQKQILAVLFVAFAGAPALAQAPVTDLGAKTRDFQKGLDAPAESAYQPKLAASKIKGKTAAHIFDWVKTNIRFEPYTGEIRGPSGVLIDKAGNSVDQASLLVALFRERGLNARFARGRTTPAESSQLLKTFAGKASLLNPANLGHDPSQLADPTLDPRYTSHTTEHVWAEVLVGDTWTAADPLLTDRLGQSPLQALDRKADLWDDLQTTLSLEIEVSLNDGQKKKLLRWRGNALDAASGFRLTFTPHPDRAGAVTPTLALADQTTTGELFPTAEVASMTARVSIRRGLLESRFTETLAHPSDKLPLFSFDQAYIAFSLLNTYGQPGHARELTQRALHTAADAMQAWAAVKHDTAPQDARPYLNLVHEFLPHAIAVSYLTHFDTLAEELAFGLGVRPLLVEPRFATTALLRKGDSYAIRIQIRDTGLDAMPRVGVPEAAASGFLTIAGRIDAQLQGTLLSQLTGENFLTVDKYFQAAEQQRTPVTTVDGRNIARLSKIQGDTTEIKNHIRQRGGVVLLTTQPVALDGTHYLGYWSLNPETGHLDGKVGGGLVASLSATRSSEQDDVTQAAFALMKRLLVLSDNTNNTRAHLGVVCDAKTDVVKLAQAFCATTAPLEVPATSSCVKGRSQASLDVHAAQTCEQRTEVTRCGVSVASALLTGELTALYDLDSGKRAFGLTCTTR